MNILQTISLAILQGITEFLPVSSSAHLILLPKIIGWDDQGLSFDIAVHLGTLFAVLVFFRYELRRMISDWVQNLFGKQATAYSKLAWAIGFGTIPVGFAGLIGKGYIETSLRSPLIIAITTIGFGVLLGLASIKGKHLRDEHSIKWREVLIIGCAQAISLIPGTSRSGITMTAGLMLGLTRKAAARYSFLLGIPVILLSGGLTGLEILEAKITVNWLLLSTGFFISAIVGYICIQGFLFLLDKIGVLPFVIYRLLLGCFLFWMFF